MTDRQDDDSSQRQEPRHTATPPPDRTAAPAGTRPVGVHETYLGPQLFGGRSANDDGFGPRSAADGGDDPALEAPSGDSTAPYGSEQGGRTTSAPLPPPTGPPAAPPEHVRPQQQQWPPPAPNRATPPAPEPGFGNSPSPGRPGAPPDPRVRPPWESTAATPAQTNWGGGASRGGAAPSDYNYVDSIRSSDLVPTRKLPPRRGWRKGVLTLTAGLVNLGRSADEREQDELQAKIRTLLRGRYKIGVLGKGGAGKTTLAASLGSIFAELRQDDRVVAIDADTAFGKLASRIDPKTTGSYWELAADQHLRSFADIRSRVGSNASGLFVLAGEHNIARRRVLDPAIYREATAKLDNHFTISIIDCGSTMDAPVTQEVLRGLDALLVVSSPWIDGASAAGQTMEWLANNGYTGLLQRTVVVLNDSDGHADKRTRNLLAEQFGKRGQVVVAVPFDPHLRPGGLIDVDEQVSPATRRRLLEIAASIAEHFATTTDGPRARR